MEERLTVLQQGGIFGLMQGDFVSYSNGVYNVRKYINISTVFVAVSVLYSVCVCVWMVMDGKTVNP